MSEGFERFRREVLGLSEDGEVSGEESRSRAEERMEQIEAMIKRLKALPAPTDAQRAEIEKLSEEWQDLKAEVEAKGGRKEAGKAEDLSELDEPTTTNTSTSRWPAVGDTIWVEEPGEVLRDMERGKEALLRDHDRYHFGGEDPSDDMSDDAIWETLPEGFDPGKYR